MEALQRAAPAAAPRCSLGAPASRSRPHASPACRAACSRFAGAPLPASGARCRARDYEALRWLTGGVRTTITVLYYQNGGRIGVQLDWSALYDRYHDNNNVLGRQRVPSTALFACPLATEPPAPAAVSGSASCGSLGYKACVPSAFTACALSRYPSGANQRRVVQSTRSNAALGHYQGKAGVVLLDTWKTPLQTPAGMSATDWVATCATTYECYAYVGGVNRCLPGGGGGNSGGAVSGSFAVNVFANPNTRL